MKKRLDSSYDREVLSGKTREQLIEKILTLRKSLLERGGTSHPTAPVPAEITAADRNRPLRTCVIGYSVDTGFLSSTGGAKEIFHQVFTAYGGLEQLTRLEAYRPDGTRYGPQDWPFTRSVPAGQFIPDEEVRVILDDGTTVFLLVSSYLTYGPTKVLNILFKDITGQKMTERALRESEERFRQFMNNSPAIAWIKDDRGRYVYVSGPYEKAMGVSFEDHFGKTDFEVWPEKIAVRFRERDLDVLDYDKPIQVVETTVDSSGETRYWLNTRFPFHDVSGKRYVAGIGLDVTKRERAEEALRESEERFRALTAASSDVVYRMSPDWSEMRFLRGRDFIPDTDEPSPAWLQRYIHPDDQPGVTAVINEAIRKKGVFELEHRVLRVDGTLGWTFSRAIPLFDGDGNIVEWLGAATDITPRKQMEEHLAADLDAMTRLQRVGTLFVREGNLQPVLAEIVDAAMAISRANFGTIQLLDPQTSDLKIAAHRGFQDWWLEFWDTVSKGQGVCGTALERGTRVIVEDVEEDPIFAGTRALEIQLEAGVRAVQSTPLVSRSGKPLGMFSTHYRTRHRPDDRTLGLLDLLARQTADIIERAQSEEEVRRAKVELERRLQSRAGQP